MKKMRIASMFSLALLVGAMAMVSSCGSTSATASKSKGIVLQEGDKATLTNEDGYTTIVFPETLTSEDLALYGTDFLGYILKSNGPITTDGGTWDSYRIYYYLHNSKEWLHQGVYANPYEMQVSKIKSIRIANSRKRLRDFVDEMPLLANSKEKKSDQSFQDEISFGNSYYIFIEIVMKDR
ncbi:MAG: hypothetical protein J5705_05370 [Bacteroidaceae bacterium]|nr:hypothetical protein [Bacteroidaceae bacterium]